MSRRDRKRALLRAYARSPGDRPLRRTHRGGGTRSCWRANIEVFVGGLVAQRGDVVEARALIASATTTYEDLGQLAAAAIYAAAVRGEVELLANDAIAAEQTLSALCAELDRTRAYSHLASASGCLAEALYAQGRLDEAEEWTRVAESHSAVDDLDAQPLWKPVRAKIHAFHGALEAAERLAARRHRAFRDDRRAQPPGEGSFRLR